MYMRKTPQLEYHIFVRYIGILTRRKSQKMKSGFTEPGENRFSSKLPAEVLPLPLIRVFFIFK